jgi:hypothetical protein
MLEFPGWAKPHNIVGDNFVVVEHSLELEDLQLQESEVMDARWYPVDQLESDLQTREGQSLHAPQPLELYQLGIAGMRAAIGR